MERQDKVELGNISLDLRIVLRLLARVKSPNPLTRTEMNEILDILNDSAKTVRTIRDRTFQ